MYTNHISFAFLFEFEQKYKEALYRICSYHNLQESCKVFNAHFALRKTNFAKPTTVLLYAINLALTRLLVKMYFFPFNNCVSEK